MKYLKLFEEYKETDSEIKQYLTDIFIEHQDDDYKSVDIQLTRVFTESKEPAEYRVMISSDLDHPFYLEDIYDNVLIAMEYLKDYGFTLTEIHCDLKKEPSDHFGPTQTTRLSKYLFYDGGYEHIKNVKSKYSESLITEHPVWWIFIRGFVNIRLRFRSNKKGLSNMIIY